MPLHLCTWWVQALLNTGQLGIGPAAVTTASGLTHPLLLLLQVY